MPSDHEKPAPRQARQSGVIRRFPVADLDARSVSRGLFDERADEFG